MNITRRISAAMCAYSVSIIDRAIACCLLELQLMRLGPRKTQTGERRFGDKCKFIDDVCNNGQFGSENRNTVQTLHF